MNEFLAMGGYGKYVWLSFALTFTIVVLNVISARRAYARARSEARRRLAILKENA